MCGGILDKVSCISFFSVGFEVVLELGDLSRFLG